MPKKYRGALAYLTALMIIGLAHTLAVESDLDEAAASSIARRT